MKAGLLAESACQRIAMTLGPLLRAAGPGRRREVLDGATLRDLGVCRSELESFRAEAEGTASRTRLRCPAPRQADHEAAR